MTDFEKSLSGWYNEMVRTAPDMRVRVASWKPAEGLPKMLFLGGLRCFAEKYTAEAEALANAGYQAVTMDWRNQGRSNLAPGVPAYPSHVGSFDEYITDLATLMPLVMPTFVIAHSMGAHLALRHWAKTQIETPLVLTSPFLGTHPPPSQGVTQLFAGIGSAFGLFSKKILPFQPNLKREDFGTPKNHITRDKARFDEMFDWSEHDKAFNKGGVTFGWLNAFFKSLAKLEKRGVLGRIKAPVLAFVTVDDPLVSGPAQERLLPYVPGIEIVPLRGCLHEPLREEPKVREAVIAHIRGFVRIMARG